MPRKAQSSRRLIGKKNGEYEQPLGAHASHGQCASISITAEERVHVQMWPQITLYSAAIQAFCY
eukprot:3562471-Amphidinium_carterae.1